MLERYFIRPDTIDRIHASWIAEPIERYVEWLTAQQIAAHLGVHHTTAKRFACEGFLRAVRADDKGTVLFEPPTGPLPRAHPGKRFRDRRRYPQCASHTRKGG